MNHHPSPSRARPVGRMLCAALWCAGAAQAADIDYALTSLGSDLWRYDYTLVNSAGSPSFDEFTVYFDLPDAQKIIAFTAPVGWNALVVPVDPNLPASGFFDAVHIAGVIAAGSGTSGFSVEFRAAAGVSPGTQRFELVVSDPFQVVASGITTAVPEPSSYALMLAGLGVLTLGARVQARSAGAARGTGAAGALS